MRLGTLDLNLFVAFEAIYRERNLTRAAETLSITQPGISNALTRLRQSFDDQLFVRDGRVMVPTPVAENIIGPVRSALSQLGRCIEDLDKFDPATAERTFTVSMKFLDANTLLPKVFALINRAAPGVRLHCLRTPRREITRQLTAGRLDLAVDLEQLPSGPLHKATLMQENYVYALRGDHPLAGKELSLEQFLTLKHIVVSSRPRGISLTEATLNKLGFKQDIYLRLNSYEPAFEILQTSDLALSGPRSLLRDKGVAVKPLPFETEPLSLSMYWHPRVDREPANLWLRQMFIKAAEMSADVD